MPKAVAPILEQGRRLAPSTSRLTAVANIASATFASTGLVVALKAGKVYEIRGHGLWQTSATASTYQMRLNYSGTLTAIRYQGRVYTAVGLTPAHQLYLAIANQGASPAATAAAAATNYPWEIDGLIRPSADGNLVLEHARAAGAGTCTMAAESYFEAEEVA